MPNVEAPPPGHGGTSRFTTIGLALSTTALAGFVFLQYHIPPEFSSPLGLNVQGAGFYARALWGADFHLQPLDRGAFVVCFRTTLGCAWLGYALAIFAGITGRRPPTARTTLPWVAAVSFLVAVWCPPSLSNDVHSYHAYARVAAIHGHNPYTTTPSQLAFQGDPAQDYVNYLSIPSVYGPTWMLATAAMARILDGAGAWWNLVCLKLIAGASLVLAAILGRSLVEGWRPGKGDLILAAIGLNPLLIIEGPGNGHNDILMMSLLLASALLHARGKPLTGDLSLAMAIGVKFLPLLVVPWVILDRIRGRRRASALAAAALCAAMAVLPVAACFVPFWEGPRTFSGVEQRLRWGGNGDAPGGIGDRLRQNGLPGPLSASIATVAGQWPAVVAYITLTAWVIRRPGPRRMLEAWSILATVLIEWTMGIRFPWYLAWILIAAIPCASRVGWLVAAVGLIWAAKSTLLDYCVG